MLHNFAAESPCIPWSPESPKSERDMRCHQHRPPLHASHFLGKFRFLQYLSPAQPALPWTPYDDCVPKSWHRSPLWLVWCRQPRLSSKSRHCELRRLKSPSKPNKCVHTMLTHAESVSPRALDLLLTRPLPKTPLTSPARSPCPCPWALLRCIAIFYTLDNIALKILFDLNLCTWSTRCFYKSPHTILPTSWGCKPRGPGSDENMNRDFCICIYYA